MTKYYSRLQLKVHSPLNLKDLKFKFIVYNKISKKNVYLDEGVFDNDGFTKWYNIFNLNTILTYKIYYRNEEIQVVTAKAYPTIKNWSFFDLKTTIGLTKKVNENIKEIYLDHGNVGWYLVKKKEKILDWSNRIFKKPLNSSDWSILKSNNSHLSDVSAEKWLEPGQVIILCNNTTSKNLSYYKSKAKIAENKLITLKKDSKFDPFYFAGIYDQFYEIKKQSDIVGLVQQSVQPDFAKIFKENLKNDPFVFASKESLDASVNLIEHAHKEAATSYTELLKYMDYEKSIKSQISTRRNFSAFQREYVAAIDRMNKAAGLKFFAWDHGINYKNPRDAIRKTVFVRAKNYSSIDDYIKNMEETSKVSKVLKFGGRLVFAWDVYDSAESVADVYKTGDSDATRKEILKQTGKIEGGLAAGALGAYVGGLMVTAVIGSVGLPLLVVIGVAAVGVTLGAGYLGGVAGASATEYSYEKIKSKF